MKKRSAMHPAHTKKSGVSKQSVGARFKKFILRERTLVILFTLLAWVVLTYVSFFHTVSQNGDTAFVAQVLYNFKTTFTMQTSYYASTSESIDHIWYQKADKVCNMDLETRFKDTTPWGHNYFIAYLLIPLARVMDVELLVAILHSGIYTSVLLFTYLIARKNKLSIPFSLLFAVVVSQHPLWRWGFDGQFYFNRFFLPLSAAALLLLEGKRMRYMLLFIVCLLAFSSNEINGVYIAILLLTYLWVRKKVDWKIIAFSAFFFIASIVSTSYIQAHYPLRSTQQGVFGSTFGRGFGPMVDLLKANIANEKTMIFFAVNMLAMGIYMVFDIRLVLPFLFIVLPNLLLSVGGAEKTGWQTHYHTGYFIPLIWMSVLGLSKINHKPRLQMIIMVFSIMVMAYIEPFTFHANDKPNIGLKTIVHQALYYVDHGKYELDFRQRLRDAVGEDSTISTPETASYHLYDHVLYYYPMGIDSADVVLLKYDGTKTGKERFYSINYGQQDGDLDVCIFERMEKNGFDFDNPTIVNDWAVLKRKKAGSP